MIAADCAGTPAAACAEREPASRKEKKNAETGTSAGRVPATRAQASAENPLPAAKDWNTRRLLPCAAHSPATPMSPAPAIMAKARTREPGRPLAAENSGDRPSMRMR